MTSFPHNLVLDIQPHFGLAQSTFLNLYNFLINWRILMKIVAKCLAFISLSYQAHVKVCNPIALRHCIQFRKKWYHCLSNIRAVIEMK